MNFAHDRSWKGVTAINLNIVYTWLQLAGNQLLQMSGVAQEEAAAVQVLASYDGWLSGAGEKVELSMTGDLNSAGVRQYICIDRVRYCDS